MQIANRVFVVTGGGNGIGREVVLGLLAKGARVAAVDLRDASLAETAALAPGVGERLSTHAVDVSDAEAVGALPAIVLAAHGQVDGLLNVAGIIQPFVTFTELSDADVRKVMDVNFWGVVNTCRAFLPLLQKRPVAALVNVSSMGGFTPVPGQTVYGASKAAVKLLTEGLYAENRDTGLDVTIVFPGAIGTDIAGNSGVAMGATADDAAASGMPMTSPQDAAAAIIGAVEKGSYRITIGKDAAMLDRLSRLAPQRATDLIAKKMKALLQR